MNDDEQRACSSAGESTSLIMKRSEVRVLPRPQNNDILKGYSYFVVFMIGLEPHRGGRGD